MSVKSFFIYTGINWYFQTQDLTFSTTVFEIEVKPVELGQLKL